MAIGELSKLRIDKSAAKFQGRRKFPKKLPAIIAAVILLFIIFMALSQGEIEVETVVVSRVYPSQTHTLLNASGYVVAQRKAAVSSKGTGRLEWLGVEEGSKVKKGEIIARLEDSDVAAAREQAAADLESRQSALIQASAELDDASLNFNRSKDLIAKGFIARMDYDSAEARYKRAEAVVSGARSAIRSAEAALVAANVAVEYTRIRAPFDAVVLTKDADIGDIVTPFGAAANAKAAVVTIADMSSLQVEADVSESNLSKIKKGQPCEIQLDALPDERFAGQVHMIVPTADRSKASVMVKVRFLETNNRILPEMSARVGFLEREVPKSENQPKTALNPAAVVTKDGKATLFVAKENRVVETNVTIGEKMGDMIEIREGVKPGDKVVLNPPKNLKNGSKISIAAR